MAAFSDKPALVMGYTNHRGDFAQRTFKPMGVRHGVTEHHPNPTWLMDVWDLDKGAMRAYAIEHLGRRASADHLGQKQRLKFQSNDAVPAGVLIAIFDDKVLWIGPAQDIQTAPKHEWPHGTTLNMSKPVFLALMGALQQMQAAGTNIQLDVG